jgi:tetratricopeptide (TPR) repeat protein
MAIKRDKILKSAEKLVQKGRLDQAVKEYEKLLAAAPDDTNTINRLGDLYGRVGEIDSAVTLYQKVAEKFADQGFLPKAIAMYKKINRLAPQRLDIFERLGELYLEQGLKVEARGQFKMLAEHFAKTDDLESAIRVHQRLVDLDPGDAGARLKFADVLLEAGSSAQALEAYRTLGASLIERDQLDEAERLFRRLIDREIPDGEIMVAICDRLLEANRVTAAQELLNAGLAVSAGSIPLRTLQVRASLALGATDDAVALAQEILAVEPDNPEVRGLVGHLLIADGDQAEAAEMMIPAAEALLEKADYLKAQRMLRELVGIAPDDERILRLAIRAFRPSGDQATLTRLTASLAEVCFAGGQEDQAKRLYLELVVGDPTNELYRARLAQLDGAVGGPAPGGNRMDASGFAADMPQEITFTLDGDELDAGEQVREAPASEPLVIDPTERINEAAVFAKYGLNDRAIKHLEGVIRQFPDHTGAREALAKVYLSIGERDRAHRAVAPVIRALRSAGNDAAAEALESRYGVPPATPTIAAVDEDDDIIIVEIDGDELDREIEVEAPRRPVAASTTSADEIIARALADVERRAPRRMPSPTVTFSDPEIGAAAAGPTRVETVAPVIDEAVVDELFDEAPIDDDLVEEELVEITTGADGPSFNDLAQLDLFIDQELLEDARAILARLENDYPADPDLAERRSKLNERSAPARPVAQAQPRAPAVLPPPAESLFNKAPAAEEYIDLAKELEEELAEEEAMVEEATGRGKGEALLDEVFREFQKGVAEQLSDEDSDTHFNLGIAYKEMGLLEEAIGEFRVASHDPAFFVEACTMIGVCTTELGRFDESAEWYQKALVAPNLSADARTALRYELASAYERTGKLAQAFDLFEEIRVRDPAYRDVGHRIAALSEQQRQIN